MASALRAVIGRAAIFLRGPRPSPPAPPPAAEVATLTPSRRLVSEKLLVFLRGPPANPAVALPVEEVDLLMKPTVGRRGSASCYSRRTTRVKPPDDSGLKAIPWFLGTFLTLIFLEGYEVDKDNGEKPREG